MWSTFAGLLESRKIIVGISSWLSAAIIWLGLRGGLELPLELVAPLSGGLITFGVAIITAIAHEDGKAKGAGMAPKKPDTNNAPAVIAIAPTGTTETNINAGTAEVTNNTTTIPPPLGQPSSSSVVSIRPGP